MIDINYVYLQYLLLNDYYCKLKIMNNNVDLGRNYLDRYFSSIRSKGRYTFTYDELKKQFPLSDAAITQSLSRVKKRGEIVQIRKGFYAIIPPEYSIQGILPPYLFIDDLLKSLNKPYYVGLLSAAALHGAAHQQPMEYFVIAQTPAPRSINNKKLKISFFSKSNWEQTDIEQKITDAGYLNVSSPELTALDLLTYVDKIGLNRAVTVLQELAPTMKVSTLGKTAKRCPSTPVIQRLGYLLEKVLGEEKLAESLLRELNYRSIIPVLLSTKNKKKGDTDQTWKVIVNMEIESDL